METKNMHILILSCSSKKKCVDYDAPAFEVYDGVFFSVYKKAVNAFPNLQSKVALFIISAKYGLIEANKKIAYYDLKMTMSIAQGQRENNTITLQRMVQKLQPESIVVVMGKTYLQSIDLSDVSIPVKYISGEIGVMLHGLKEWLYSIGGGEQSVD